VKTCHIYPVSAGAGVYQWKWKCVDGKRKSASSRAFDLYYDCVEDARNHGAAVDLERSPDEIADATVNSQIVAESSKGQRA
jgi:hypothetical protein